MPIQYVHVRNVCELELQVEYFFSSENVTRFHTPALLLFCWSLKSIELVKSKTFNFINELRNVLLKHLKVSARKQFQ